MKKSVTSKNIFDRKAQSLFVEYPTVNEIFYTVDGLAFFAKNEADNHAANLKCDEITTFKRK